MRESARAIDDTGPKDEIRTFADELSRYREETAGVFVTIVPRSEKPFNIHFETLADESVIESDLDYDVRLFDSPKHSMKLLSERMSKPICLESWPAIAGSGIRMARVTQITSISR